MCSGQTTCWGLSGIADDYFHWASRGCSCTHQGTRSRWPWPRSERDEKMDGGMSGLSEEFGDSLRLVDTLEKLWRLGGEWRCYLMSFLLKRWRLIQWCLFLIEAKGMRAQFHLLQNYTSVVHPPVTQWLWLYDVIPCFADADFLLISLYLRFLICSAHR